MFPPESYGVDVTVASLRPPPGPDVLPEGVVSSRPSRIGELLAVASMTAGQKAAQLLRVQQAKNMLAGFEAELVVGLAADRPATVDRRRGQTGAASERWADDVLDEDVSEFFADELAMILNCSRTAATQLWEQCTTLRRRLPVTWAALADGELDWPRARAIARELGWPARETEPEVVAEVEAAVLPRAGELSVTKLRALTRSRPRHPARRRRPDGLRESLLPVPPAPQVEDPRSRVAVRHVPG